MDKTLINLLSILIGGAGLFAVLTKFSVPDLNMTFLGENPFAVKRDSIDKVMTWMFMGLALAGVLIQVLRLIFDDRLAERLHGPWFYALAAVAGVFAVAALVIGLAFTGNKIAKAFWLPKIIESQRELFQSSAFIVEHDGWREDQIPVRQDLQNKEFYRQKNYETVNNRLGQIERLLDLPNSSGDLTERLKKLGPYFDRTPNKSIQPTS